MSRTARALLATLKQPQRRCLHSLCSHTRRPPLPLPSSRALVRVPRRHATVHVDSLRVGNVIELDGKTYEVESSAVHMRGRAHTTITLELRDLDSGKLIPQRLRPADKVELVMLETDLLQLLYRDDVSLHFMNPVTFEQIELPVAVAGDALRFMADGMMLRCKRNNGQYVSVHLPGKVECEVIDDLGRILEAGEATSTREVKMASGAKIKLDKVPNYVLKGDIVVVRTDIMGFVKKKEY